MTYTQQQIDKYKDIYNSLNKNQQQAVDTIEGPVIVNAGPGTGKTQILAARIGKILLETDTEPNNILCLTYTDNGAVEMRNRLLKMVGTAAYKIQIHTFHSFCNEVIQDNLTYFGKLSLEPIGDLEQVELFYKLIDSIEKDNILKRFKGEVYFEKNRLKSLYSRMKKESWSPAYLNERIDAYLNELPTKDAFIYKRKYKEHAAGDPKAAAITEETQKLELLRAAVNLYPRYNKMMADISRYDFDDMLLWVLDAFEKNNNLLLDYQERFLYFLVDEFQDTSGSQNLLIKKLTGYWELPNLFVVGDADQSIFSFQDANVQNIEEFRNRYADDITQIDLLNNYRSTQFILNAAHHLIIHNQLRITNNNQPLVASNTNLQAIDIEPQIVEYTNAMQEAVDIAVQIEALVKGNISGKEIAVIYRNHDQVAQLIEMLESKKIAVNTRKKVDLLQLPFIQKIITILTWVDKENYMAFSADDLLFKIMHFDVFTIPALQIAKLSIAVNERNYGVKVNRLSLRSIIAEPPPAQTNLFKNTDTAVKDVSDVLENLLKQSNNITLQHLVEMVIQKAGFLSYVMRSAHKPWLMQVLNAFFGFIKEECKRRPDLTLHELLHNFKMMSDSNIAIPLYKVTATDEGINLITAHSAKGSEFEYVFVIGCTQNIWDDAGSGSKKEFKFPDNLHQKNNIATSLEESRRLFYVAITRAKTHLQISFYNKDKKDKPQTKSTFITEINEASKLPITTIQVADDLLTDYLAIQFAEKAKPEIALMEDAYINQMLKRYTLSVTHLNNYLDCPIKFYYQNLIKVPSAKSESMVFGSAVHHALEQLFKKMRQQADTFPAKEIFVDDFKWYLQINRDAFTPEEFKRRNDYGDKILPAYYDAHINNWNKVVVVEKALRNIPVKGVPLNGKLDKLEFNGKKVNVVDYKTGRYDNAKKKLNGPSDKEPNGGDYWRQAVFYKILLDNDVTSQWEVVSTSFEFVEPVNDEYKTETVVITPADITTVTSQIVDVWQKIQNKEFKTGCGKPECEWCKFVKDNNIAVALHDIVDDET